MALKVKVTAEEWQGVPETLRGFYKATETGDYLLDAEGIEDVGGLKRVLDDKKSQVAKLQKQIADITARYDGIDPDQAREQAKLLDDVEKQKLLKAGNVDALIAKALEQAERQWTSKEKAYQAQIDELSGQTKSLNETLSDALIDNGLRAVAARAKVRDTAVEDLILRGKRVWKLEGGKPTPVKPDGTPFYGKKAPEMISMDEWVESLRNDAAHLFEPSTGANTAGSQSRGGGEVVFKQAEGPTDFNQYQAAKDAAQKAGVPFRIAGPQ